MVTAIEKNNDENDENSKESAQTSLQFLINSMEDKKNMTYILN